GFDCDWSSDVCSSDLADRLRRLEPATNARVRHGNVVEPDVLGLGEAAEAGHAEGQVDEVGRRPAGVAQLGHLDPVEVGGDPASAGVELVLEAEPLVEGRQLL